MSLENDIQSEDWLIDQLGLLVETCGTSQFLERDILTPNSKHFPIRWRPDASGVKALAERLMAHAGMSTMKAEVRLFTDETRDLFKLGDGSDHRKVEHNGAAACFMGIEGATAWFGCETHNLPDSETMVGIMGHEVAHAFRSLKGITREDRALEEYLTDITTIYLGFGLFTANGSHQYTSSGEQYGTTTIMRWSHRRLGYLPTAAMCFLLASQVVARGSTLWERARLARLLRPNQRGYFTDTVRDIIGRRAELLAMLKCT